MSLRSGSQYQIGSIPAAASSCAFGRGRSSPSDGRQGSIRDISLNSCKSDGSSSPHPVRSLCFSCAALAVPCCRRGLDSGIWR